MYVTLLSHALVSRAVVRARISMIFRSQKVKRYPARRQSTYQRIVGFLLVSFILLGSLPTSVLASEVLSVVGTRGEEGEAVTTFLPAISASSGEEIQAPNEGVSVSVSGSSGEQIIGQTSPVVSGSSGTETFVPQVSLASFGEEGVVIPLPISVPVISGSSGDGSMSPPSISGSASDGFAVAPNPSGGAGDSGTLPPLISGSAGEGGAVTSVATGGADEGSSLTLDIHGSVGDGSTTSSILGSAGETIPTLSAYGDAGETLISTPVVTGSSGEIITHTLLVVSGSSGETISPTLPVVSGSSGEMVRATAPMISGSSGETTLVIVGNAGETLISTPVVTGSSGEIITHTPPVVSGSSGEVLILAPPVVSGSSGETTVPAVTGSAGETITGTPSVIGSSGETISFTPPVVLGSAGEESVLTPPVVLGNSGEIFVSNTSPLVTGSAGENIESFPPIIVVDTDVCSNIADNQATIPSGYVGNADGTCTESVVAVVDVCSNIAGAQATVPSGYTASGGVCTEPVVPPVDVCSNVAGDQATLPSGYTQNTDGTCTQQDTGGGSTTIDLCSNIADVQATIPTGYTANADGTCQQNTGNGGGGSTTGGNTGGNSGGSVVQSGGGGGGGGGSGSSFFGIYNEAVVELSPGVVAVRWTTNHPGISRVVFGTTSVATLATTSPFLGYERGVIVTTSPTTNHVAIIEGLEVGVPYFFRALSTRDGYKEISGKELSFVVTGIATITEAKDQCPFLSSYLQRGGTNDIEQIVRLQAFLKLHEELPVVISGTYDLATEQAVHAFQNKYADEVLLPWGKDVSSTGYVYITTKWKINQLICGGAELTTGEQSVIQSYQTRPDLVGVGGSVSAPIRGQESELIAVPETTASTTIPAPFIIGAEEGTNDQLASVFRANDTQCTFDTEDSFLFDTVLFLPRLVYCVLHPLVGAK